MLVYQRQDMETWLQERTDEPFPFLEPIASPRGNVGGGKFGSSSPNSVPDNDPSRGVRNGSHQRFSFSGESYISDEDAFNNNNADAMDVSSWWRHSEQCDGVIRLSFSLSLSDGARATKDIAGLWWRHIRSYFHPRLLTWILKLISLKRPSIIFLIS